MRKKRGPQVSEHLQIPNPSLGDLTKAKRKVTSVLGAIKGVLQDFEPLCKRVKLAA